MPWNVTTAPARGSVTRCASVSSDSESAVTRAHTSVPPEAPEPPDTGGISASSSPASSTWSSRAYSRLTAITSGSSGGATSPRAARASLTRAPSGSVSVTSRAPPARSRSIANSRTVTSIRANATGGPRKAGKAELRWARGESRLHATEPLLERAPQLTRLADGLERAEAGGGGAVVVEGSAGIGKTELLSAGCDLAVRAGFQVLTARCSELEQGIAFGVARQLLESAVRDAEAAGVDPWTGAARLAAPVLTMGGDPPAANDPFAVLHGLYWLCSNLCDQRRLMLAVDDVQWSDPESRRWLVSLARRLDGLPAVVVMTARSGPPEHPDGSIEGLFGQRAAELITLAPLSPPATAELVRDRYDPGADDAFCSACHAATAGNPFLLRELLAAIRHEGLAATESAAGR